MELSLQKSRAGLAYKVISAFVALSFLFTIIIPPGGASAQVLQGILNLPAPGMMVMTTAAFTPLHVKGLTLYPQNPLQFDFIVDTGNSGIKGEALKEETRKLVKYFLAALTIPEDELWVNLSPYEKDKIIADSLSQTDMGRDMLAQDYLLKQLSASMLYPEDELGQKFWDRVYKKAYEKYGTTQIPLNTFNKIWIVPQDAVVYEQGLSTFVVKSTMKVMLEEDYVALSNQRDKAESRAPARDLGLEQLDPDDVEVISGVTSEIVREVLIPEIEKEVNEGETFANLRQIFNSMILAAWYKKNLRNTLLGQVYVDQNKTAGIDLEDKQVKEKIYNQYLEALKKGVYNYIREDYDIATDETIPRKYFSGGVEAKFIARVRSIKDFGKLEGDERAALEEVGTTYNSLVELTEARASGQEVWENQENSTDLLVAAGFDKSVKWITQRRITYEDVEKNREIASPVIEVLDFLDELTAQGFKSGEILKNYLLELLKGEMPEYLGSAPQLNVYDIPDRAAVEAIMKAKIPGGHASDRGIHLFTQDAKTLIHELMAFLGLRHTQSVAYEILIEKWLQAKAKQADGTMQPVNISSFLSQDQLSTKYTKRLAKDGEAKNWPDGFEKTFRATDDDVGQIFKKFYRPENLLTLMKDRPINTRDVTLNKKRLAKKRRSGIEAKKRKESRKKPAESIINRIRKYRREERQAKEESERAQRRHMSSDDVRQMIESRLSAEHHHLITEMDVVKAKDLFERYGDFQVIFYPAQGHREPGEKEITVGMDTDGGFGDMTEKVDVDEWVVDSPARFDIVPPSLIFIPLGLGLLGALAHRAGEAAPEATAQLTGALEEAGRELTVHAGDVVDMSMLENLKNLVTQNPEIAIAAAAAGLGVLFAVGVRHLLGLRSERIQKLQAEERRNQEALVRGWGRQTDQLKQRIEELKRAHPDVGQRLDEFESTHGGLSLLMKIDFLEEAIGIQEEGDDYAFIEQVEKSTTWEREEGDTGNWVVDMWTDRDVKKSRTGKTYRVVRIKKFSRLIPFASGIGIVGVLGALAHRAGEAAPEATAQLTGALEEAGRELTVHAGDVVDFANLGWLQEWSSTHPNFAAVVTAALLGWGLYEIWKSRRGGLQGIPALSLPLPVGAADIAADETSAEDTLRDLIRAATTSDGTTGDGQGGRSRMTPEEIDLIHGAQFGDMEKVQSALASGVDVNTATSDTHTTALMGASEGGYVDIVRLLLEKGADVNMRTTLGVHDGGQTALWFASIMGHPEIVTLLLDHGADINVRTDKRVVDNSAGQETPLMIAAYNAQVEVVAVLLERGADVNAQDEWGSVAYEYAQRGGTHEYDKKDRYDLILRLLVQYGAYKDRYDDNKAAQEIAVQALAKKDVNKLRDLLAADLDVNAQDASGKTLLMEAVSWGGGDGILEVLELLIEYGADIDLADNNGHTALWYAQHIPTIDKDKKIRTLEVYQQIKAINRAGSYSVERIKRGGRRLLKLTHIQTKSSFTIMPQRGFTVTSFVTEGERDILHYTEDLEKLRGIFLLGPWVNRLALERANQNGYDIEALKASHPDLAKIKIDADGNANHGVLRDLPWRVEQVTTTEEGAISVTASVDFRDYQVLAAMFGEVVYRVTYTMQSGELDFNYTIKNFGKETAPAFIGAHPCLNVDINNTTVSMNAPKVYQLDDKKLPGWRVPVAEEGLDFSASEGRSVSPDEVKMETPVFTDFALDADGNYTVKVHDRSDDTRIDMTVNGQSLPHFVLWNTDTTGRVLGAKPMEVAADHHNQFLGDNPGLEPEAEKTGGFSIKANLVTKTTAQEPGGIDFNPALLNMQIKRDPNGVPLPLPQQPIPDFNIDGFIPVILDMTPVMSIPVLLGIVDTGDDDNQLSYNELEPFDRKLALK